MRRVVDTPLSVLPTQMSFVFPPVITEVHIITPIYYYLLSCNQMLYLFLQDTIANDRDVDARPTAQPVVVAETKLVLLLHCVFSIIAVDSICWHKIYF